MITPDQCRSARAWLNWNQEDLAIKAGVSLSTVRDFEKGARVPIDNNLRPIDAVFLAAGIEWIEKDGEPAGFRFSYRIKEKDTYLPVLEYLDRAPNGFLTTSELILALEQHFEPKGEDAAILDNRGDTRFTQIVRNIISHRTTPTNLIAMGWALYEKGKRGLRITEEGRRHMLAAWCRKTGS